MELSENTHIESEPVSNHCIYDYFFKELGKIVYSLLHMRIFIPRNGIFQGTQD